MNILLPFKKKNTSFGIVVNPKSKDILIENHQILKSLY